jgi:CubicO group peptidase (beta-lactamase class C family)
VAAAALAGGRVAGLSIAVSVGGRPVVVRGYGLADRERPTPATAATVYRIASVTKQITAAAVLRLVEQGRLELDADVRRYLPELDTQGRSLPLRRLLDHTAGLPDFSELPELDTLARAAPSRAARRDTLARLVTRRPALFAPGTMMAYTNSDYLLLGLVLERVTGRPYGAFVRDEVLARAGMRATAYCSDSTPAPQLARGYEPTPRRGTGGAATAAPAAALAPAGLRPARALDNTWAFAAGSLCATVQDLDAWNRALHGGRILGPAAYRTLTTPGTLADGTPLRYAAGLAVTDVDGRRAYFHGGTIDGFVTQLVYFPDDSLSIAVAVNTWNTVDPAELARAIAASVHGAAPAPPPFRGRAAALAGEYEGRGGIGEPLRVRVALDAVGQLTLESPFTDPGQPAVLAYAGPAAAGPAPAEPAGETFTLGDLQLTFRPAAGGVAARLDVDAVFAHMVLRRRGP